VDEVAGEGAGVDRAAARHSVAEASDDRLHRSSGDGCGRI
jgi:hypothetical protein